MSTHTECYLTRNLVGIARFRAKYFISDTTTQTVNAENMVEVLDALIVSIEANQSQLLT